jgi:hypothetical protein
VRQDPARGACIAIAVVLACAPLQGQGADATNAARPNMTTTGGLQAQVDWALQDAAQRTRLDASQLRVVAESVTWPDGALGCPEPGRQYVQVLVSGYRIRISAGSQTLEYHGSHRGRVMFCPASRIQPPTAADPRL